MDERMYDDDYVRLTALLRDAMPFSPTLRIGLNYLALSGLLQQSAFSVQPANNSTNKHFNNSTPEEHTRAESPDYFSPIPQERGIDIRTLFSEG